ncbi:calmodulin-binding protein 60 B [Lathyrus oleraceus]|uniref:Calmodulin-binding protein 60 B n=1 Tax=Pisum sativum TaxID=3888 RepID=A0A9D4X777_PEA|nr:calmodulin-binding protein 60 B [Pisum sativum]XP_050920961.1 calmodulin-binding protein 60 B [Pisum sativum]KAI5414927.1 Calmodulin-binding protein 60 B [Pisum sativum]
MQKPTKDGVNMGKRTLEGGEDDQPERKRPALASVIVEALKVDSLQKLCSSLEPILRRVVSEEVERALAKLGPARLNGTGRSSPKRIEGPDGRNLRLQFRSRLALPLFTGGKVEGEQGAPIHVVLVDANSSNVITSGPESCIKLDVVVLEGDFNNEDDEDWTQEEFESHVVKEREGKRPLLTGDLQVTLKEGVGTLGELTFTDNSSWIRSRKFRLGMKVAAGFGDSIRIREAKTVAFTVKDHRGELYKKHYPPSFNDDVWRLEKIGKDGSFHKKLNNAGIFTVEDFLRLVVKDQQKLRNILGSGMSNKMWEALLDHAKTCVLSGKLYVYYPEDTRNVGVIFNHVYELRGLITGEQFFSADSLSDHQKVYVDSLVKKAYDNWEQVVEYDGKSLVDAEQNNNSVEPENELHVESIDFDGGLNHQLQMPSLPMSVTSEHQINSGMPVGGYIDNMVTRYPSQALIGNSSSRSQFEGSLYLSNDQLINNDHQPLSSRNDHSTVGLALGPPQSSTSGFHAGSSSIQPSAPNPFDDWSHNRDKGADDFFSEDEIRVRSNEILENEDMQHLLRLFSMGGHASMNTEDGYSFPPFMPSPMPSFDEDRSRPGRAVVGWLKIKAAMRWGFFIRKIAAEKRAQIEELDE